MSDWYAHAYDESKRRDARRDFIHGDVMVIPNSKTSIISTFFPTVSCSLSIAATYSV
jgi:hypothetical protein